ncbi:MAG: helix-turn-helix domain-containing protein [Lachnospiraceae bacterium]|nr:helix-turn-helix domain-containing protein [Lachnospiraceae bacterium]
MKKPQTNEDTMKKRLEVGLRIRRERLIWDMTQEELSEVLGISANYLGQIERGNRELSRNMEERLCRLFNLNHDELHATGRENTWPPRVSEAGVIFNDLSEEDVLRLLHSCSPGELQLCGHVIRSMLLYLRNPSSPKAISSRSSALDGGNGLPSLSEEPPAYPSGERRKSRLKASPT